MNDIFLMHGHKCIQDTLHDYWGILLTVLTLLPDTLKKLSSIETLKYQVYVIIRLIYLMQLDDIIVIKLPQ